MEIENLEQRSGIVEVSIMNRAQDIEARISRAEDTLEEIETTLKEHVKTEKFVKQDI